jgi:hypothetical protein
MKSIFSDCDIISTYSRAQAISDGVLVDITTNYPNEARLFKFPVAFTQAVFGLVEAVAKDNHDHQATVIWDILFMSINFKSRILSESEHLFLVSIGGRDITLKVICSGGDNGEPVLTFLTKFED